MSTVVKQKAFVGNYGEFEVQDHPKHHRLYHIDIKKESIQQFLDELADISVQQLEYTPFMRYMVAKKLTDIVGKEFADIICDILQDRDSGGFTAGLQQISSDADDYIKFSTAITHLVGKVNFDAMSGKYYARFTVKHTYDSDSYLRQAYRNMTLHTDGTFVEEKTDWLLMMKFAEEHAVGGESRILHLDDWEDLEEFSQHPLATYKFTYRAPASKNVDKPTYNTTFFEQNNRPCLCFIDQFVYPDTIEQAQYLHDLSASMEESPKTHALQLPVGDLVMLNNTFWTHGRAAFEKEEKLYRELMRQRGSFYKVL